MRKREIINIGYSNIFYLLSCTGRKKKYTGWWWWCVMLLYITLCVYVCVCVWGIRRRWWCGGGGLSHILSLVSEAHNSDGYIVFTFFVVQSHTHEVLRCLLGWSRPCQLGSSAAAQHIPKLLPPPPQTKFFGQKQSHNHTHTHIRYNTPAISKKSSEREREGGRGTYAVRSENEVSVIGAKLDGLWNVRKAHHTGIIVLFKKKKKKKEKSVRETSVKHQFGCFPPNLGGEQDGSSVPWQNGRPELGWWRCLRLCESGLRWGPRPTFAFFLSLLAQIVCGPLSTWLPSSHSYPTATKDQKRPKQ